VNRTSLSLSKGQKEVASCPNGFVFTSIRAFQFTVMSFFVVLYSNERRSIGIRGQCDSALFILCVLTTSSPPRNYSHWIGTHALYWNQISHLPRLRSSSSSSSRSGLRSVIHSKCSSSISVISLGRSLCPLSFSFLFFGAGILRISMRTVAYVKYALNRCAIADRVSSLTQQRALRICDYI